MQIKSGELEDLDLEVKAKENTICLTNVFFVCKMSKCLSNKTFSCWLEAGIINQKWKSEHKKHVLQFLILLNIDVIHGQC